MPIVSRSRPGKLIRPYARIHVRKNDVVKIIAGRDKGKTGRVLQVDRHKGKVLVEGIALIKRHTRPNPSRQIKGGIAERESPIDVSNVTLLTADGKPTRVSYRLDAVGGKTRRTRISRKTGEVLDRKG